MKRLFALLAAAVLFAAALPVRAACLPGGRDIRRIDFPEYSSDTLIVRVRDDAAEGAAEAAFAAHGLRIKYAYRSFSAYAVQTERPLSAREMDALIAALGREDCVLSVSRDRVWHLVEPIRPVLTDR